MTARAPARRRCEVLLAVSLAALLLAACDVRWRTEAPPEPDILPAAPGPVQGMLRMSLYGPGEPAEEPLRHVSEWVNGPDYDGMEDNDLRGFLDGLFIYGWNQPGQIHNRAGRRDTSVRFGETELFRTLVRFADVALPADTVVHEASLEFHVEAGPQRPLDVMLYAVNHDWDPGQGGTQRDNTSPPETGEVWWGARAEGVATWGFPGAGYASETDPDADTPASALATARWKPGDETLRFSGLGLARFVEERARRGQPLNLLVRLSDRLEDTPDTVLYVYSGNEGDRRNAVRRPRLRAEWSARSERFSAERPLVLDRGRRVELLEVPAAGIGFAAVSFVPEPGSESPRLLLRDLATDDGYRAATFPWAGPFGRIALRAEAARDPVPFGHAFETGFRDTWVRTAPPEEQEVMFHFVAPSGREHDRAAVYEGDYRWSLSFEPDELGRWRYRVESHFVKHPYESAENVFDVIPGEAEDVARQLAVLLERVRAQPSDASIHPLAPRFWELERALMQRETPASLATEDGQRRFELLLDLHEALGGKRPKPRHWRKKKPMERDF